LRGWKRSRRAARRAARRASPTRLEGMETK